MTDESCSVYALHTGDGVYRYVGQTTYTVLQRTRGHRKDSKRWHDKHPVYAWIWEAGPENVVGAQLQACTLEELDVLEAYWITKLRAEGHPLLNQQSGGRTGFHLSDELRNRFSEMKTGVKIGKHSEEANQKKSERMHQRYENPEEREAQSKRSIEQANRPGAREAISERVTKDWTPERRAKQAERLRTEWQDPAARAIRLAGNKAAAETRKSRRKSGD